MDVRVSRYQIQLWVVLVFKIGLLQIGSDSSTMGCKVINKLPKVNMTAAMTYGNTFDNVNNKLEYANLNSARAFCARIRKGFYIQVSFGALKMVTELQIQGFKLNGTGYRIGGFTLAFSLDGRSWYQYNDGKNKDVVFPKYFIVSGSGDSATVTLPKPAIGRYIRLFPRNPGTGENKYIMCIRFDLYGCNEVPLPYITSTPSVETTLSNTSITLSCSATGMLGMVLEWTNHSNTASNVTVLSEKLQSDLVVRVSFLELFKYTCITYVTNVICVQYLTCQSYYIFDPLLREESKSKVVVKVMLPDTVTSFSVMHKNKSGVVLSWGKSLLNDFNSSMLNYSLTCNVTGRKTTELLAMSITSIFLKISTVYSPYQCLLRLLRNNKADGFPFSFNQTPAVLNFHSLSIRPDVRPIVNITKMSHDSVKIYIRCNFTKVEFGLAKGIMVNATMMSYGNRDPTRSLLVEVLNKKMLLKSLTNYVNSTFVVRNLKPWSRYKIQVAVFNKDKLLSNSSFQMTKTRQGRPSRGPSLVLMGHQLQTSLTLEVKQKNDHIYNNGVLVKYKLLVKPINKTFVVTYNKHSNTIFEVNSLKASTMYKFQCKAATKAGYGPYGAPLTITMDSGKPSPPVGVTPVHTSYFLLIKWEKPLKPGGMITQYEIRVTLNNHTTRHFFHQKTELRQFAFNFPTSSVEQISIRAYTTAGYGDWSASLIISISENPLNKQTALIIGFSVAFALFAAFVVMCFVYFRRQYRSHPHQIKDDYQLDSILNSQEVHVLHDDDESDMDIGSLNNSSSSNTSSTYNLGGSAHDPVPVEEFSGYINMVKQDDYKLLLGDFHNQMSVGQCYSCSVAERPENIDKNRYTNICAYDHSRIILKYDCEENRCDYINANSIYGYTKHEHGKYKYVSTQGPTDGTAADFWHMVWQEGSNIIVMLTNLKENDKVKCAQYWPHESTKTYGKIAVTLDKIDKTADYITRTFQLEQLETKEQRIVRQFHFVPWPDHGVPDYPTALLSLRRRVRHYYEEGKPMIAHCSAGVGRSGCFILIDAMLERIDNERTVDIFSYLNYMRTRRIYMVQTFKQYIFAHTAVLEYITFGNTETFVGELDKKFKELVRGNGMAEEFALLEMNKVSDCRPDNMSKVLLRDGISVEASLVDGFKQRNAFILTKAPSEDNVINFWKMVLEKQCHTIVMLNKCQEDSHEYFKYWPDVDGHNSYQDIAVMLNSEIANGNIMTRKVKVTTNNRRCEVNHFQFVDWPDTDIPDQRVYNNICTLMQAVEKSQHNLGNGPIIVHSGNDYGRSGTFIAVYNSTERLKVEQLIDVLQCVRAIRITQPLAVDNVSQYQFIYNMLRTYLEGFENYCNYKEYNVCRSPFGSTSSSFS